MIDTQMYITLERFKYYYYYMQGEEKVKRKGKEYYITIC